VECSIWLLRHTFVHFVFLLSFGGCRCLFAARSSFGDSERHNGGFRFAWGVIAGCICVFVIDSAPVDNMRPAFAVLIRGGSGGVLEAFRAPGRAFGSSVLFRFRAFTNLDFGSLLLCRMCSSLPLQVLCHDVWEGTMKTNGWVRCQREYKRMREQENKVMTD